jgi:hypothetical protein
MYFLYHSICWWSINAWTIKKFGDCNKCWAKVRRRCAFVAFNGYDDAICQKKIFVYGPSGCGKSRSLFEFITSRVKDYDKLYIINPRNAVGNKIERGTILQVITESSEKSAIIWDNFPDDLVRRDIESVVRVLEVLTSRDSDIVVTLKPRYLELYRGISNRIPYEIFKR